MHLATFTYLCLDGYSHVPAPSEAIRSSERSYLSNLLVLLVCFSNLLVLLVGRRVSMKSVSEKQEAIIKQQLRHLKNTGRLSFKC